MHTLTRLVVGIVLSLAVPVHAGWKADCRHQTRVCRLSHGLTLTTSTTTTTTMTTTTVGLTVTPYSGYVSQNCSPSPTHCFSIGDAPLNIYCEVVEMLAYCSLPQSCR